jgi:hypothetical protein
MLLKMYDSRFNSSPFIMTIRRISDAAKFLRGASGHAILPRVASSFRIISALMHGMIPASLTIFRRMYFTSKHFFYIVLCHFKLFASR